MPPHTPPPAADILVQLSDSLTQARSLEELVRPLLDLLQAVTGMDATYLTRIDTDAGIQEVLYAVNTHPTFSIPEQLTAPWMDTLCRRALELQQSVVEDIGREWSDSQIAQSLGISSYASVPVHDIDGKVIGTLCAASPEPQTLSKDIDRLMGMFAHLIGQFIAREHLIEQLRLAHEALRISAATDLLTGLPNRRALLQELERRLKQHRLTDTTLLVSFIDLDGFKTINDTWGHDAGDQFLRAIADTLRAGQRPEDYCARYGGDEFVTLTSLRTQGIGPEMEAEILHRLTAATSGRFTLSDSLVIDYPGPSIGLVRASGHESVTDVLAQADAAMYRSKHQRQGRRGGA